MLRYCKENWMLRVRIRYKREKNYKRKWTSWNLAKFPKNTKKSPKRARRHTHPSRPSSKTSNWKKSTRIGAMHPWIARPNPVTSMSSMVGHERDRRILLIRSVARQLWKDPNLELAGIRPARSRSRRLGRLQEELLTISRLQSRSTWMQQVRNKSAIRVQRTLTFLRSQPNSNLKFLTMFPSVDKITTIKGATIRSVSSNKTQKEKRWVILLVCLMRRGSQTTKLKHLHLSSHQWTWDKWWISKINNLNSSNFNLNSCANLCRTIKAHRTNLNHQ